MTDLHDWAWRAGHWRCRRCLVGVSGPRSDGPPPAGLEVWLPGADRRRGTCGEALAAGVMGS